MGPVDQLPGNQCLKTCILQVLVIDYEGRPPSAVFLKFEACLVLTISVRFFFVFGRGRVSSEKDINLIC